MKFFSWISQKNNQKGFVLLFSFVIAVLIALVVSGMFRISLKESILASTARESTLAFYAADSAIDCILYHSYVEQHVNPEITCGSSTFAKTNGVSGYEVFITFRGRIECAQATVVLGEERDYDFGDGNGPVSTPGTLIISRGYNVCLETSPDWESNLLLERRLEAWFPQQITTP